MPFAVRPFLGSLAIVLLASTAFANNNVSVTSATAIQQPKKEGRIWSGFINVGRSTSLVDFQDGTRTDGMDYSARFNVRLNKDFSFRTQAGYSQDLNYPENNDFSDTSLSLIRNPFKAGKRFLLGYRVGASLPTSKDSNKRQSLQTSLGAALNFMINPDRLIQGFDVSGSVSMGRNIHQYETALDGRVNTQYTSNQALSLGYSFQSGVSLSANFLHRNSWSYQNVMRDAFEMSQEIGYQFNSTFAGALGHTNSGSTLKANGNDSNVELINENTSLVYASFTAIF